MTYKELALDALEVAKNAHSSTIAADHLLRAQVYATLALIEQGELADLREKLSR